MTSPLGPSAFVTSVWHVAQSSDCRTCSASVGSKPVADRMMVVIPRSILKGPNIGLLPCAPGRRRGGRRRNDVAAGEAGGRAEILVGDLMADRAGDAVVREAIGSIALARDGQVVEHAAFDAVEPRLGARHRHMARRALVLNRRCRRRVIESLPAARRPASTDRATNWPSSTRASSRRSTRLLPPACASRCDRPCTDPRSRKSPYADSAARTSPTQPAAATDDDDQGSALPSREESSVEPVPQQIHEDARSAARIAARCGVRTPILSSTCCRVLRLTCSCGSTSHSASLPSSSSRAPRISTIGDHARPQRFCMKLLPIASRQKVSFAACSRVGRHLDAGVRVKKSVARAAPG